MKVGLVGFAGSGKTTVFNTLTGLSVPTGYGGEVHLGTVKVPDERIDALSRIFKPKKTTYAEITFSDIPGEHGAGHKSLSRQALDRIRDQDVVCLVLRAFDNPAVESAPDPVAELQSFLAECLIADAAQRAAAPAEVHRQGRVVQQRRRDGRQAARGQARGAPHRHALALATAAEQPAPAMCASADPAKQGHRLLLAPAVRERGVRDGRTSANIDGCSWFFDGRMKRPPVCSVANDIFVRRKIEEKVAVSS